MCCLAAIALICFHFVFKFLGVHKMDFSCEWQFCLNIKCTYALGNHIYYGCYVYYEPMSSKT